MKGHEYAEMGLEVQFSQEELRLQRKHGITTSKNYYGRQLSKEALNNMTLYNERIFVHLFVNGANIQLLMFSIRFTTVLNPF